MKTIYRFMAVFLAAMFCAGAFADEGISLEVDPQAVLEIVNDVATVVNEDACIACGDCVEECPMGSITEIEED